jgi:hypothetical protein
MEETGNNAGGNFKNYYLRQFMGILLAGWVVLLHYFFITNAVKTRYNFFEMIKLYQKYGD